MNKEEYGDFIRLEAKVDQILAAQQAHVSTHTDLESRLRVVEGVSNSIPKKLVIQWGVPAGLVGATVTLVEVVKQVLTK